MKTIKEYISESLFDDEDDLLDKELSTRGLDWISNKDNAYVSNYDLENAFIDDNGKINMRSPYMHLEITLYKPMPNWVIFDKELSDTALEFNIEYPIKNQSDIPKYGVIRNISGNLHNINVKPEQKGVNSYMNINKCNSIKNLTLHGFDSYAKIYIDIYQSKISFEDLAEIKLTNGEYIVVTLDKKSVELGKILLNMMKTQKYYNSMIDSIQPYLRKMYANGLTSIVYKNNYISLKNIDGDIKLSKDKDYWVREYKDIH